MECLAFLWSSMPSSTTTRTASILITGLVRTFVIKKYLFNKLNTRIASELPRICPQLQPLQLQGSAGVRDYLIELTFLYIILICLGNTWMRRIARGGTSPVSWDKFSTPWWCWSWWQGWYSPGSRETPNVWAGWLWTLSSQWRLRLSPSPISTARCIRLREDSCRTSSSSLGWSRS